MSNIKLKDHNWAAEGIYDTNQSKSQQTINSDVSTKIGQATLQTSSQNLSGATNELKGRADTLDSKYDNVVTVANTQPSSEYNKVWLPLTVSEGTQVPTWAEHQALESSLNGAITSVESAFYENGTYNNIYMQCYGFVSGGSTELVITALPEKLIPPTKTLTINEVVIALRTGTGGYIPTNWFVATDYLSTSLNVKSVSGVVFMLKASDPSTWGNPTNNSSFTGRIRLYFTIS